MADPHDTSADITPMHDSGVLPPGTLLQDFRGRRSRGATLTRAADRVTRAGGSEQAERQLPIEGDVVGGCYRLVRRLGEGMFGHVYLAERTDVPEHRVALKVVTRVVYAGRNVERELVMLAAAAHPHIVQLKDHGMTEDYVWLTMPLYEGETLAERLERGTLSLREAYEVFLPVAHGVEALHERGLRHQDIKPENIFLARFGDRTHPVLLDLGVAVETKAEFVAGTVLYCSPEQLLALGGVPGAAGLSDKMDTYCLATTLLRSLVGEQHFVGGEAATPYELARAFELRETMPLPGGALPELTGQARELLTAALGRWLARDPDARPTTSEMAAELDVLLEQERDAAAQIERGLRQQKASLRRVRRLLGAMAVAGAVASLYAFSKRETLRLAGELERARQRGAESFDKLDTCVAAHELAQRRTLACTTARREDHSRHERQLDIVVKATGQSHADLVRRLDGLRNRWRTCEDDAKKSAAAHDTAAKSWAKDKSDLTTELGDKQRELATTQTLLQTTQTRLQTTEAELQSQAKEWQSTQARLVAERDKAQKARGAAENALTALSTSRNECREDLASCQQAKNACVPPPAPPTAPKAPPGGEQPAAPPSPPSKAEDKPSKSAGTSGTPKGAS